MRSLRAAFFCVGFFACGLAADSVQPNKGPYDEMTDGSVLVADALKRATNEGKNVLLVFGANWCSDCRAMDALFKSNKAIAAELDAHFVVAKIDVGKGPDEFRNGPLVKRFEVAVDTGIPVLVVVDARGRLLTHTKKNRLADTDHQHPERVLDFLKKWAP